MSDCDSPTEVDQVADSEEPILPWPNYQQYFKVLRVIEDNFFYKKLEVKCLSCVGTKCYKMDSRSNPNIRKHLSVSTMLISYLPMTVDLSNVSCVKLILNTRNT